MVFLQHLHVRVVGQAFFADRREVGRLPAATVQVGLDLGRHSDSTGENIGKWPRSVWLALECVFVGLAPVLLACAFLLRRIQRGFRGPRGGAWADFSVGVSRRQTSQANRRRCSTRKVGRSQQ